MAKYNEILVGRYNRLIQKLLSMKGTATLQTFSSEMQATISMFFGVENRYLELWDRFANGVLIAAGGLGISTGVRLRNPGGSNVISVVELCCVTNAVALADSCSLRFGATALDLAAVQPSGSSGLDSRGRAAPTLILSSGTASNLGRDFGKRSFVASGSADFILDENQEIPLLPGQAVEIDQVTANQQLAVSYVWRERLLEESERA